MNILVVGGGGREHAIITALSKSPKVEKIWAAPGNGGISALAECFPVKATDLDGILGLAKKLNPDFVFVAPDDPLVMGMVDRLNEAGFRTFGPRANAAILEGSKVFSKALMKKYGIPTAGYETFTDADKAIEYIKAQNSYPAVIKCDGLALGKGVVVAQTVEEAKAAVRSMIEDKAFGQLGDILGGTLLDSRETLSAVDDPYYHTDHHWTTMGAQAAYTLWAQATGHTARSYALTQATDRFRGTLYSKVLLPDSVYDTVDYCPDITIVSADCDGTERDSLYDLTALEKKDKYELFLGGNYAKAVIRTGTENGKHLLLIKDSFANSFVPFLTGDYETITMVDLRYCREKLQPLADEADDILVLYEITNFAADGNLFKLNLH